MKIVTYTHKELYGMEASYFKDDLPFMERRKMLLKKRLQVLIYQPDCDDKLIYDINKAIEFWSELIEDIKKDLKDDTTNR